VSIKTSACECNFSQGLGRRGMGYDVDNVEGGKRARCAFQTTRAGGANAGDAQSVGAHIIDVSCAFRPSSDGPCTMDNVAIRQSRLDGDPREGRTVGARHYFRDQIRRPTVSSCKFSHRSHQTRCRPYRIEPRSGEPRTETNYSAAGSFKGSLIASKVANSTAQGSPFTFSTFRM
jgi:hypothetical protein